MRKLKLAVVGDDGVGKTSLLISYTNKKFPEENIPALCDSQVIAVSVAGSWFDVELNDTHGFNGENHRTQLWSVFDADVVLVCFSVDNRQSLENVTEHWIEDIKRFHLCHCPPFVLVACQQDVRYKSVSDVVTHEEGLKLAESMGMPYIETSALTRQGFDNLFETAVRQALSVEPGTTRQDSSTVCCCWREQIPQPPLIPPVVKSPKIQVEPPGYANDWMAMLENPVHADVTFILDGQHSVEAHEIILCSASEYFRQIFDTTMKMSDDTKSNYTMHDLHSGKINGIVEIEQKGNNFGQGHRHTVVKLSSDIKPKIFVRVLEFLYSGEPKFTNEKDDLEVLVAVIRVAETFQLPRLSEICQNIQNGQGVLNPSISSFVIENLRYTMKELYFNSPEMADITFSIEGKRVYAHKSVLSARCETMAVMFGGQFAEGQTAMSEVEIPDASAECFLALLEYLYTDYAPSEDVDVMELVVLADKYGVKRLLHLCESIITKDISKNFADRKVKRDTNVIGVLQMSQNYNAVQLTNWCLHYISTRYKFFKNQKEFSSLSADNKAYIEENRWPPLSYLHQLEEYERTIKGDNCVIL